MVQYVCFKEHLHKIVSFGNFRKNVKKIFRTKKAEIHLTTTPYTTITLSTKTSTRQLPMF